MRGGGCLTLSWGRIVLVRHNREHANDLSKNKKAYLFLNRQVTDLVIPM